MFNISPLSKVALAVFGSTMAFSSFANVVSGTVQDNAGTPVAGAKITLEGSSNTVYSDENGRYQLTLSARDLTKHAHIHVHSTNHEHTDQDLGLINADQTVNFSLSSVFVENIIVKATRLETSVIEAITPLTVLSGEELRKRQAATLGETLKLTPGVHSTYFAGVAASPIIRGNDGPRVQLVQNGLNVGDVSRIGPDHAIATDTSSATQIEVLRGPATLQYGSGAIGGVVNVVDNRILEEVPTELEGEAELRFSDVNNERFAKVELNAGADKFAFHLDASTRETDDIEIPDFARTEASEDDIKGVIESSSVSTDGITAGLSYIDERGFVGFSAQRINNFYGVPGEEEGISIDSHTNRYQLSGKYYTPIKGISEASFTGAYTDYEHTELEGDEIGTLFTNKGVELRLDLELEDIAGWHGIVGTQYSNFDTNAVGEEAFVPKTDSEQFALFLIEKKKINDVTVQFGGRIEQVEYQAAEFDILQDLSGNGDEEQVIAFNFPDYDYDTFSLSAGSNWHYSSQESIAVSLSYSQRAPSAQELLSGGTHIATGTYELGLAFDLDENGVLSESLGDATEEVSTNIDVTWRHFSEKLNVSASVYYSDVDDYIFQRDTGFEIAGEEGDETFPVLIFEQSDAQLYGFEFDVNYKLNDQWELKTFGDFTRAKISSEDLPRIPPLRIGSSVNYFWNNWEADVEVVWYDEQTKTAELETSTDGYTLVNAGVSYETQYAGTDWRIFARIENITDEEARVNTSFLKDQAPLPGRNLQIGIRTYF